MTTIRSGDNLPNLTLTCIQKGKAQEIETATYFKGKSILFGVPGAFTPICSNQHLPSFVTHYDSLKKQGFDQIACLAVNDPFVLEAWAKTNQAENIIDFIADWDAGLTQALGLAVDLSQAGLGLRSQRFTLQVDNLRVQSLVIEDSPGTCDKTNAATLVK